MCAEKHELVLNSGHSGPVLCLARDEARDILFTGGNDGTLRIWQGSPLRLIKKIQASHLPIRKIQASPKNSDIAIVESDGGSLHSLSVWNWQSGKKKYSADLAEVPLILEYSPQGNFIVVSKTDWKSLTFFDAPTGKVLPLFRDGFGIVSFILISGSENTLVSYTPSSGNFTYWDLRPGVLKQTVKSVPELKNLTVYSTRYVIGTLGSDLVAVDLVTGNIAASTAAERAVKITVNPNNNEIAVLTSAGPAMNLSTWTFAPPAAASTRGFFYRTEYSYRTVPPQSASVIYGKDRLYSALSDGSIGVFEPYSTFLVRQGVDLIDPVTGIMVSDGTMHGVTKNSIFSFYSDFFSSRELTKLSLDGFYTRRVPNPLFSDTGIIESRGNSVYLWSRDPEKAGTILEFDLFSEEILNRFGSFDTPLSAVKKSGPYLFCLEKNGFLYKINTETALSEYAYPARGIQSIAPVGYYDFVVGKNISGTFQSPLLSINTRTGETVSVTNLSAFIVFNTTYDPVGNKIYFLGLEKNPAGKTETRLYSADFSRLDSAKIIDSSDFTDIDADILVDSKGSPVYSSLGSGTVRKWDGNLWTPLMGNNNLPGTLHEYEGKIYSINKDGSVSVWDKSTGRLLGDLILLRDGSWLVFTSTGYYMSSAGERFPRDVTVLRDGKLLSPERSESYRLK
jgi:WD40 repeat protein